MEIEKLLLKKGESFYNFGKIGIEIGGFGAIIVFLIELIANAAMGGGPHYVFEKFLFLGDMTGTLALLAAAAVIVYICLVLLFVSLTLYFKGLHYMGLAQICNNTSK